MTIINIDEGENADWIKKASGKKMVGFLLDVNNDDLPESLKQFLEEAEEAGATRIVFAYEKEDLTKSEN